MTEHLSRKQNALLARKKSLLNEIQYYEIKVNEERSASNNNVIYDDSSDSEVEFTVEVGLSVTELKLKQRSLKTCLQATQELTGVAILQSEVNILVLDPVFEGERPVTEEGVWREVVAECRIDLVPFSINYYVHKPRRLFGPTSYRNLQVTLVKSSHEVELDKSVLKTVRQPSDAIEVIRNYSSAHRSRRTTLVRLAEKYGETLFMVPMPEGGYKLKCAELMEVQWSLQNKWSPLAPFHHRMVFDLEFMDESYIKTISTLHKQIIDPTIDTDDRTLLLARIIDTCLEAKAHTTQNQAEESTESESEAAEKLRRRRTTLDQEPQQSERNIKKDSEVMAPPKSIPKKTKPRGKENAIDNKAKPVKRTAGDGNDNEIAKKAKTATTDKPTETKNIENKTKSTKTKPVKVTTDLPNSAKTNDADVVMSSDTQQKNSENKTKSTKNKPDKVNKDLGDGTKINNIDVIMSIDKNPKNIKNKTKSTKTKPDNFKKDLPKGTKTNDEDILMSSDTHPKNIENKTKSTKNKDLAISVNSQPKNSEQVTKNDRNKNLHNQLELANNIEINNTKEFNKTEKGKKNYKVNQQEQTQKSGSLQVNKNSNNKRQNIEDNVEPNKRKSSNVIKNIKPKQKDINDIKPSQSRDHKSIKDNVKHKMNTDQIIKAPETKKSIEKSSKENINKPKRAAETNINKEKMQVTKLPNLAKSSKDLLAKKPTMGNYLKNSFLPKANKLKSALPTKIPRISPRKLSSIKSGIQDISKNSRSSQKSLQKATNIPRLLKKPQIFKASKV